MVDFQADEWRVILESPELAMASQLLKAGDAALLLPQAARCKGPLDRLLIAHEGCSACFVPMTAKSVSEVKPSNFWGAHHFETSVREKG